MTRLYENRAVWTRTIAFTAFLVLVFVWGIWELWAAWRGADATSGAMFGIVFTAGSIYALYQLVTEWRDVVSRLERDDATGALTATVWQPTGPLVLTGAVNEFRNWRPHVKTAGRIKTYYIHVDFAGHPRPLRFDIGQKTDVNGLRQVAPEAVAELETMSGRTAA